MGNAKRKIEPLEQDLPENVSGDEIILGDNSSNLELDQMFDDLEAGLGDGGIVINGAGATESQLIEAGNAANIHDLKTQALEELDQNSSPAPDNAVTPAPQKNKRVSTAGMAKSEALAHALGEKMDELLTIDTKDRDLPADEQFDKRLAMLEALDKLPKKIGEKASNLFSHVSRGAQLSNYTKIAINLLVAQGELTSKQLKDAYIARPYSEGTANSQCTQLMNLLPFLGIATKGAGKLVVNPDSTLLPLLTEK